MLRRPSEIALYRIAVVRDVALSFDGEAGVGHGRRTLVAPMWRNRPMALPSAFVDLGSSRRIKHYVVSTHGYQADAPSKRPTSTLPVKHCG